MLATQDKYIYKNENKKMSRKDEVQRLWSVFTINNG